MQIFFEIQKDGCNVIKKIMFLLALFIMLTASLSAQTIKTFNYHGILTEQQFNEAARTIIVTLFDWSLRLDLGLTRTNQLPNPVPQTISNYFRNYNIHTGDVFLCILNYQEINYIVFLRITNSLFKSWEYYAWLTDHSLGYITP